MNHYYLLILKLKNKTILISLILIFFFIKFIRYPVNGENSDDKTCLVFGTWVLNNNLVKYNYLLNNYNQIKSKCINFSSQWRTQSRINVTLNYFYFTVSNFVIEKCFLNQTKSESKNIKNLCKNISITFFLSYLLMSTLYFIFIYYTYNKLNSIDSKNFIIYSLLTLIFVPFIFQDHFFLKPFHYSPSKIVIISIICLYASIIDNNNKFTIFSIITLIGLNIIQSQFILLIFTCLIFLCFPKRTNLKKIFISSFLFSVFVNLFQNQKFQNFDFDLLNYILIMIDYYKFLISIIFILLIIVLKYQKLRVFFYNPIVFLSIFFLFVYLISKYTEYYICKFDVNSLTLNHLTKLSGRIFSLLYFIPIVLTAIQINKKFTVLISKYQRNCKPLFCIIFIIFISLNFNFTNLNTLKNTFTKFEQIDSDIYSGLLNEYKRKGIIEPKIRLELLEKNIGKFLYFDPNFETEFHLNLYVFFKKNDL